MKYSPAWGRREVLGAFGALVLAGMAPRLRAAASFAQFPFSLGVASGYPEDDGVVLWTRLAPQPLVPGGVMPPEDHIQAMKTENPHVLHGTGTPTEVPIPFFSKLRALAPWRENLLLSNLCASARESSSA